MSARASSRDPLSQRKDAFVIRTSLRAAAVALLAALALTGCSPDTRPVAKVGKHTLTVADFNRAARRASQFAALPEQEAKAQVLNEMIDNELLLVAAESHGLDTTAFTRQRRTAATEQALLAALSAQIAPMNPGVSEAEIRAMYDWRKTQSDVQLVYAADSTSIVLALRRAQAGDALSQLADEFGGSGMLPPGGHLGFRIPGSLPQPIDDAARTLPVGKVGGPYHAPMGWFLVRVAGRMPATVKPYEQERASLENLVRQRKWQGALLSGVARLAPEYHLTVAPDAGQRLFQLLTPGRVGGLSEAAPTPEQRKSVLALWDGGAYTVGDAWDDLQRPEINKPFSSVVPSLSDWVRQRGIAHIAIAEAKRRHLDQDPAFVASIEDQLNEYIVRGEYETLVSAVPTPNENELRAAWEPMKDRYPMLRSTTVAWAVVADTGKALALGQLRDHLSLRDAAHAVDPSIAVHEQVLEFPNADPSWSAEQGELQQLQPGQWGNPNFVPEGIRILQLVNKSAAVMTWDQLPLPVRQSLAGNLTERSRSMRVAAYTDSLKRAVKPIAMPEALRHVPWPPAAEPAH
jgi:parvulin-like peptidyl-prolyl isomerase